MSPSHWFTTIMLSDLTEISATIGAIHTGEHRQICEVAPEICGGDPFTRQSWCGWVLYAEHLRLFYIEQDET